VRLSPLTIDALAELKLPQPFDRARDLRSQPDRFDPAKQLVEQFFVEWEVPQAS
jgi:hypothetical protein